MYNDDNLANQLVILDGARSPVFFPQELVFGPTVAPPNGLDTIPLRQNGGALEALVALTRYRDGYRTTFIRIHSYDSSENYGFVFGDNVSVTVSGAGDAGSTLSALKNSIDSDDTLNSLGVECEVIQTSNCIAISEPYFIDSLDIRFENGVTSGISYQSIEKEASRFTYIMYGSIDGNWSAIRGRNGNTINSFRSEGMEAERFSVAGFDSLCLQCISCDGALMLGAFVCVEEWYYQDARDTQKANTKSKYTTGLDSMPEQSNFSMIEEFRYMTYHPSYEEGFKGGISSSESAPSSASEAVNCSEFGVANVTVMASGVTELTVNIYLSHDEHEEPYLFHSQVVDDFTKSTEIMVDVRHDELISVRLVGIQGSGSESASRRIRLSKWG